MADKVIARFIFMCFFLLLKPATAKTDNEVIQFLLQEVENLRSTLTDTGRILDKLLLEHKGLDDIRVQNVLYVAVKGETGKSRIPVESEYLDGAPTDRIPVGISNLIAAVNERDKQIDVLLKQSAEDSRRIAALERWNNERAARFEDALTEIYKNRALIRALELDLLSCKNYRDGFNVERNVNQERSPRSAEVNTVDSLTVSNNRIKGHKPKVGGSQHKSTGNVSNSDKIKNNSKNPHKSENTSGWLNVIGTENENSTTKFFPKESVHNIVADIYKRLEPTMSDKRVAFTAYLGSLPEDLGKQATIPFDRTVINEHNGFDTVVHTFICPVSGIYFFQSSLMAYAT